MPTPEKRFVRPRSHAHARSGPSPPSRHIQAQEQELIGEFEPEMNEVLPTSTATPELNASALSQPSAGVTLHSVGLSHTDHMALAPSDNGSDVHVQRLPDVQPAVGPDQKLQR
ncbi:unnamed protein product [Phytophthora fragariaefolia]|uniref:Unnamed protein product n=1 Tax=Phytophthora fragariaefolia TaxID=1490495 RepID=A0A9W6X4A7_9STRA|nr:unnamed protein product [Phytophthora fragariaefolia]